jgi:predicted HAD superfamily Cof-like phosphohydrolase
MKSVHQQRVEKFMGLAGQNIPASPIAPDLETRELRARLILEESLETIKALGFQVMAKEEIVDEDLVRFVDCFEPDLIEIADGCADIKVVTTGTLSACGIEDEELQCDVDQNNMAKFGPGGFRRDDGKWVKPPNHQPPNISKILEDQGK